MKTDAAHNPPRRDALIRRVVQDTIERRARGEALSDDSVRQLHPALMPELGKELLLLRLIERAGQQSRSGFIRHSPGETAGPGAMGLDGVAGEELDLPRLPGYRTIRAIGRGGQGLVYEAIQDRTQRRVAIKIMRDTALGLPAGASPRFDREARILAQLEHPNIVGILEGGVAGGHAYLVMEYIDGVPLDEYVAQHNPSIRGRVLLMETVCLAVHAAHLRGVIHRDLKPSNVLVEADGTPRTLDFGLAAITEAFGGGATVARKMTQTGQFIGSLPWTSPEQARGDAAIPDLRSDVYSLGLLLFIALTGAMPYRVDGSAETTIRAVTTAPPLRPSTLCGSLDSDLDTIVLKCLGKELVQRYQSAGEIAADLRAHLEGRPISARSPSLSRRVRWFVRRNKPLMIGVAAVFAALIAGLATTAWELRRASKAEAVANVHRDAAEFQAYASGLALAQGAVENPEGCGDAIKALAAAPERLRGWEWHYLMARADRSLGLLGPATPVLAATSSADGAHFFRVFQNGEMSMLDTRSNTVQWRTRTDLRGGLIPSRDGRRVIHNSNDRIVALIDGDNGHEIRRWSFVNERFCSGAMVPSNSDGNMFMALRSSRADLRDSPQLRRYSEYAADPAWVVDLPLNRGWPMGMVVSPDDSTVYVAWGSSVVSVHDARTGEEIRSWPVPTPPDGEWSSIALSPDGRIAAVSKAAEITLFNASDGTLLRTLHGHTQIIGTVAFNPAGTSIVSGSADQTIRVWDVTGDHPPLILTGHSGTVGAWFASDGVHLLSESADHTCRRWSTGIQPPMQRFEMGEIGHAAYAGPVVFDAGSQRLWAFCDTNLGSLDLATRSLSLQSCPWATTHGGLLAVDPKRRAVYWCDAHADSRGPFTLGAWNLDTHEPLWKLPEPVAFCHMALVTADGRRVAFQVSPTSLRVCDAPTGRRIYEINCSPERTGGMQYVRPSESLIIATSEGSLTLWSEVTGAKIADLPRAGDNLSRMAVSPDGSTLAVAFGDRGTIGLWNLQTRTRLADLGVVGAYVPALAFSPDGTRLAVGAEDRVIRIWHVHRGEELLRLRGHSNEINSLAWSPDGRYLASIGRDDRLILWDSSAGQARDEPDAPGKSVGATWSNP